jgi:hypothetical protein
MGTGWEKPAATEVSFREGFGFARGNARIDEKAFLMGFPDSPQDRSAKNRQPGPANPGLWRNCGTP